MAYDSSINDNWGWAKQWKHNEGLAGMEDQSQLAKWLRFGTGVGIHTPEGVDPKRWGGSQAANFMLGPGWGSVVNFPYVKAAKALYNTLKPGESPRNQRIREAEELAAGGKPDVMDDPGKVSDSWNTAEGQTNINDAFIADEEKKAKEEQQNSMSQWLKQLSHQASTGNPMSDYQGGYGEGAGTGGVYSTAAGGQRGANITTPFGYTTGGYEDAMINDRMNRRGGGAGGRNVGTGWYAFNR